MRYGLPAGYRDPALLLEPLQQLSSALFPYRNVLAELSASSPAQDVSSVYSARGSPHRNVALREVITFLLCLAQPPKEVSARFFCFDPQPCSAP